MDYISARQKFSSRVRALRADKGFTQEQLAELVDKTTEHISFLERAERSPSFEMMIDLSNALGVSLSSLVGNEQNESNTGLEDAISVQVISSALPQPAQETVPVEQQRKSDLERLNAAFQGIHDMQQLANEYGINDILQDNGGKVLQVLILLGLKISPGREGNDALDADGNEYELKTINRALNKNAGITTHHHLNKDILHKYRAVKAWYIALYEGVVLKEIYKLPPAQLEPLFQAWETKTEATGTALNNPKIPMRYVKQGKRVYPVEEVPSPEQNELF
ncbi:MAG: helix-turn-helix domain-containing protein [Janthinobacterium lividum]